uniref:hypothetical protein n=1 Tax=Altererythrobacter segetis TaxID=1104773 RepID=UPI00140A74AC|nr:hypothetical protein [Altererythrobacter segetis]
MSLRRLIRRGTLAFVAVAALATTPAAAADCDRTCLSGMLTRYIAALVAHDPSALPLTPNARFTEDSRVLKLGEGLWRTVTRNGEFRHDYLDEKKHVAVAHVELFEGSRSVLYSVALHMDGARIAGIETLAQRVTPDSRFQPTELGASIRGMNDPVPSGKGQSRTALIATALTYADGLRRGDFTDAGTPFAHDAYRVENGVITAGHGCKLSDCGMYSQRIMVHPGLLASVVAVDEHAGTVVLWMNFGFTDSYGPGKALLTYEAFKVWGGEIHAINAFFEPLPISTPRGWKSAEPPVQR